MGTTYYCDNCQSRRDINIIEETGNQVRQNGLLVQTDLHRCENGQLQVYNLFVDEDNNTRTVEEIEIPELKKQKRSVIGTLPSPDKLKTEAGKIKTLLVTNLNSRPGLRVILTDAVARYRLNIGNVDSQTEKSIFSLHSSLNTIELAYYPSLISPNENVKIWLNEFINTIERLPTNYLGHYVKGLQYLQGICTIKPEERDLRILEMILSSSEISLRTKKDYDPSDFLDQQGGTKFESKTLTRLFKLLSRIETHPEIKLSDIASTYEEDIIYLCNNLLILEDTGQIAVIQPNEFDLEKLFS